jgi:putative effector of murein hydrolase
LDKDGGIVDFTKMWITAGIIYGYERIVAKLLLRAGMSKMPSTLAAMLALFCKLRVLQKICGRSSSDQISALLKPGVDFLGKWMGLFLAPPLVSLDASIRALPPYSGAVWGKTASVLALGWTATHSAAGAVATMLASAVSRGPTAKLLTKPTAGATNGAANGSHIMSQDEAVRRSWTVIASAAYLATACIEVFPTALHRPIGQLCEASTTIGSLAHAKLLPGAVQKIFHPLVICATTSNLASRFVGAEVAPYFDGGKGVGDLLFKWLPAAVTCLGVRMYDTTDLWLERPEDFKVVISTCSMSGCFSIFATAMTAVNTQSPLSIPYPLSLPLLHRSVMSALGIEGSMCVGPESDPKLAVASILITGCIGASLGNALLELCPPVFNSSSSLVRGVAMGCSAHSIGTAGLISGGDTDAAAISGASMCLAGTMHTLVLFVPGVVPTIRALAKLPPLA